jgi:hypothetical protein
MIGAAESLLGVVPRPMHDLTSTKMWPVLLTVYESLRPDSLTTTWKATSVSSKDHLSARSRQTHQFEIGLTSMHLT